jgi:tetraacyldisaccharide-1-P 4'-kinase
VPVARFLALPDHAPLDEVVLRAFAGNLALVCTAKDATRLPLNLQTIVAWRDVSVRFPPSLIARISEFKPK